MSHMPTIELTLYSFWPDLDQVPNLMAVVGEAKLRGFLRENRGRKGRHGCQMRRATVCPQLLLSAMSREIVGFSQTHIYCFLMLCVLHFRGHSHETVSPQFRQWELSKAVLSGYFPLRHLAGHPPLLIPALSGTCTALPR